MEQTSFPDVHIQLQFFPLIRKSDSRLKILIQRLQILSDAGRKERIFSMETANQCSFSIFSQQFLNI
jgi:hypothetical protein